MAEEITEKKVRTSLEKIMLQESALPDEKKMLRYTDVERKKRFWASNSLSDPELKFMIYFVLYRNIINTKQARDLATRLQGLSGKICNSGPGTLPVDSANRNTFRISMCWKI